MKYRLPASSILETVIALVIIMTIFGIATVLFVRVTASSGSVKMLIADQLLKEYAERTERRQQFFDSEDRIDGYELRRKVVRSDAWPRLCTIHYYIYDRNTQLLQEWQQIAIIHDH
jgi:hypothetical protein